MSPRLIEVTPSAARLTQSLRDIGYDFPSAIADLVDNSIAAGASEIAIEIDEGDDRPYIAIADNGLGMTPLVLDEAMRFGTRKVYGHGDLGRYGLGLKTASLSQCRRLTVISRHSPNHRRLAFRVIDLDLIGKHDSWFLTDEVSPMAEHASRYLDSSSGTVIVWEDLDRLASSYPTGGAWLTRRLRAEAERTKAHLQMVFHRFLAGSRRGRIGISINGVPLTPWDPFALDEKYTQVLQEHIFDVHVGAVFGQVTLKRFVLPPRSRFSSAAAFERLSGPEKWNRQQGIYIYRAERLVDWGGWRGLRAIDEHCKLARASIDFNTELDPLFKISISKRRSSIPAQVRPAIERPIHELCSLAQETYRRSGAIPPAKPIGFAKRTENEDLLFMLRMAAMEMDQEAALDKIFALVAEREPGLAGFLFPDLLGKG